MSTWEERMSQRAKTRMLVAEAEKIAREAAEDGPDGPSHLHGTFVACSCGAEQGITTVAFGEDYQPPEACHECGKPTDLWGDACPVRDTDAHAAGCPVRADTPRCRACGNVPLSGVVWANGSGPWCFGCQPGAHWWGSETGTWNPSGKTGLA